MSRKILLVDHENTGRVEFSSLPDDTVVILFFGSNQHSVPRTYTTAAKMMGSRYREVDISGQGKNALDFHIAFYLGEILTETPAAECTILSNDKGFDPLIKHLQDRGFSAYRQATKVNQQTTNNPKSTPRALDVANLSPEAKSAYDFLKETQKNKRPRKLKRLNNHLFSHFRNKLSENATKDVVSELVKKLAISENNQNLTYHF